MLQKQAKSTYPSFMLYDTNAEQLKLTTEKIEQFINQSPKTVKQVFNLYYKDGFSQNYISNKLNIKTTKVQNILQKIKSDLKTLSLLWTNDITLIVGRSGTGKSTLEELLCNAYDAKSIKSYTTRPQRSKDENNHIFISKNDVSNYPNKIATTTINNHFYFTTKKQLDESQLYVIDPNGLYELTSNYPNLKFNLIYLKLTQKQHNLYLKSRRNKSNETKELQNQRLKSEDDQFTQFETKLKQKSLPKNITIIKPKQLLPSYRKDNKNAE